MTQRVQDNFIALAFDSPQRNSKVTQSSTHTLWWSPKNDQHTAGAAKIPLNLFNLCSGPNPLGCVFRWHGAILLLTTGLLAASKRGRAGSRLFITSCLWNIDFVPTGLLTCVCKIFISLRMGRIVSLLHLWGCNNSIWISTSLGEVDVSVSVTQWSTCPSNLITPLCLR